MHFLDEKTIVLERELSELDLFVTRFISTLQKHSRYVIISGYVAILLGRSRTTEDVDVFIERIPFPIFVALYNDLKKAEFWSLNSDDEKELYEMLCENIAIRFAPTGTSIPNMEVKFIKDVIDKYTLDNRLKVILGEYTLFISDIGLQIAYKRYALASQKDQEDARHLQTLFDISEEIIKKNRLLLKQHGKI